jgi:hypothetical protein
MNLFSKLFILIACLASIGLVDAQWDDKTRWDDKINAIFFSAQMGSADTREEQIALVENSDLYKRGYVKQSIATKSTVDDAKRALAHLGIQLSAAQAGGDNNRIVDLLVAELNARNRLFDMYALIMKDGL